MENGASGSSSPFQIQARLLAGEIKGSLSLLVF